MQQGIAAGIPETSVPTVIVNTQSEPVSTGKFVATWDSLKQYRTPDWFRDAKFGIWAHWGPQCQPEEGDWYARNIYIQRTRQYRSHLERYGHPSEFGFKDVIREWKADKWDPDRLVALYKRAGAQYFFAMANHCDNFDNWDSKYQPWNSVNIGPKRDIIAGWAGAARTHGLRFGISVHAAHAWMWMEPAQGTDTNGVKKGVPYDGKLTKADGKGQWWEGLDPQDLYAQNHERLEDNSVGRKINTQWNWGGNASIPDQAYCDRFYNRTMDLINRYQPDLIYFDDTALPLWPVSDAGLKIAAHFYNSSVKARGGELDVVLFGKGLNAEQRKCMTLDIERGQSRVIEPEPWQSDTCIGDWHYQRSRFEEHTYKSVSTVIQTLVNVVSKNGNLLLSIPVRGDGTIDDDELKIVEGIANWMDVNRECIFGSRPWKICGEGPALERAPSTPRGRDEDNARAYNARDIRFTTKGNLLYAIVLGQPNGRLSIKALGKSSRLLEMPVSDVRLLGSSEKIRWKQTRDALVIKEPRGKPNDFALVFKIAQKDLL
jgi:alpha-L-fucosidase